MKRPQFASRNKTVKTGLSRLVFFPSAFGLLFLKAMVSPPDLWAQDNFLYMGVWYNQLISGWDTSCDQHGLTRSGTRVLMQPDDQIYTVALGAPIQINAVGEHHVQNPTSGEYRIRWAWTNKDFSGTPSYAVAWTAIQRQSDGCPQRPPRVPNGPTTSLQEARDAGVTTTEAWLWIEARMEGNQSGIYVTEVRKYKFKPPCTNPSGLNLEPQSGNYPPSQDIRASVTPASQASVKIYHRPSSGGSWSSVDGTDAVLWHPGIGRWDAYAEATHGCGLPPVCFPGACDGTAFYTYDISDVGATVIPSTQTWWQSISNVSISYIPPSANVHKYAWDADATETFGSDISPNPMSVPVAEGTHRLTTFIKSGGTGVPQTFTPYKVDRTPPDISESISANPPDTSGWYNSIAGHQLSLSVVANDALSGVKTVKAKWYPSSASSDPPEGDFSSGQVATDTVPPSTPPDQQWPNNFNKRLDQFSASMNPSYPQGEWKLGVLAEDGTNSGTGGNKKTKLLSTVYKNDTVAPTICYQLRDLRDGTQSCGTCSGATWNSCSQRSFTHPMELTLKATDQTSGVMRTTLEVNGERLTNPNPFVKPLRGGTTFFTIITKDVAGNEFNNTGNPTRFDLNIPVPNFKVVDPPDGIWSTEVIKYTWDGTGLGPPTPPYVRIGWDGTLQGVPDPGVTSWIRTNPNGDTKDVNWNNLEVRPRPPGLGPWTPNFQTNVHLEVCYDWDATQATCRVSAQTPGTGNRYTLAEKVPATEIDSGPQGQIRTDTAVRIGWSRGANPRSGDPPPPPPQTGSHPGTHYYIKTKTDGDPGGWITRLTRTTIPSTFAGGYFYPSASPRPDVEGLTPNSRHEYRVEAYNYEETPASPGGRQELMTPSVFWTKPSPPLSGPTIKRVTTDTITAEFGFNPNNPEGTPYILQACPTRDFDQQSTVESDWVYNRPPRQLTGVATVRNLNPGRLYYLRMRVKSLSPNPLDDVFLPAPPYPPDPPNYFTRFLPPQSLDAPNDKNEATESTFTLRIPNLGNFTPPTFVQLFFTYTHDQSVFQEPSVLSNQQVVQPLRYVGDPNRWRVPFTGNAQILPNTAYRDLRVRWGNGTPPNPLDPISSWSEFTVSRSTAYTKPVKVEQPPQPGIIRDLSIQATNYPPTANPPHISSYTLDAYVNESFEPLRNVLHSPQFRRNLSGDTVATVSGLSSGTRYYLRTTAKSIYNDDFDVFGATSGYHETSIGAGGVQEVGEHHITVKWRLARDAVRDVKHTRAIALDTAGTPQAWSLSIPPPTEDQGWWTTLTARSPLMPSNTFYAVPLQKCYDADAQRCDSQSLWQSYLGSEAYDWTLAEIPKAPVLANGGTRTQGLYITVSIAPDLNALDTPYALRVLNDSSRQLGYLRSLDNGTPLNDLSASPVWLTSATWHLAGRNRLTRPAIDTVYSFQVAAQERRPPTRVRISSSTEIETPGSVKVLFWGFEPGQYTSIDKISYGVPPDKPLLATFSTPIIPPTDPAFDASRVKVEVLSGRQWTPITDINLEYDDPSRTLRISRTRRGGWGWNQAVRAQILPGLKDIYEYEVKKAFEHRFVTRPNPEEPAIFISPHNHHLLKPSPTLSWGPNTIPPAGFATYRTSGHFDDPVNALTVGAATLNTALQGNGLFRVAGREAVDLVIYHRVGDRDAHGTVQGNSIRLTIPLDLIEKTLYSHLDTETLRIGKIDPQGGNIIQLETQVNPQDRTASAQITQSGVYVLAASLLTKLDGTYAYPVPYKPSAGHTVITFKNLAVDSTITIYTIMGELVRQLHNDGDVDTLTWDVKNQDGDRVASGVYIYQIKNGGSEKRGKLMIIR